MTESLKLADLRRDDTTGHPDLAGWRFRAAWAKDDTTKVLAWATDDAVTIHQAGCSHASSTEEPTAEGTMAEARELFAIEQPKGTTRWFNFCGHCLTERIPNFGWEPTERDLTMLATMRQVLNDVRLLGHKPISRSELTKRMARYGEPVKPIELKRLIEHEKQNHDEDAPDLSLYVVTTAARS